MNRRDLIRNSFLTFGVAAANPSAHALIFPPGTNAAAELAKEDWKPIFLDAHQNETLIALGDAIIPATDTPGATAAYVNRFLDLLMSVETAETQRAFLASLSYVDGGAMKRYKRAFIYLTPEERMDYLTVLAFPHSETGWGKKQTHFVGYEHFTKLKGWISSAFYSSPVGLKQIGWDGSAAAGFFAGCEHSPDGHSSSE